MGFTTVKNMLAIEIRRCVTYSELFPDNYGVRRDHPHIKVRVANDMLHWSPRRADAIP